MLPSVSVPFCLVFILYSRCTTIEGCGQPSIQPNADDSFVIGLNDGTQANEQLYNKTGRVIGGTTARAHSWPWMVLLNYVSSKDGRTYMCGATIISDQWILTAAHCAVDLIVSKATAYVGIQSQNERLQTNAKSVKTKVVHPQYDIPSNSLNNDIALLQLSSKLTFSQNVQPICLPFPSNDSVLSQTGEYGYVTGWGQYTKNDVIQPDSSLYLQQARLPFIDPEICRRKWGTTSAQVCAGAYMKGTGQGDSGGPLGVRGNDQRWYQVGITSYGYNSNEGLLDQGKYPGVYTRVSRYCSFIQDQTVGNVMCSSESEEVTTSSPLSKDAVTLPISIFAIFFSSIIVHLF